MKHIRYLLEAALVYTLYGFFRMLGPDAASATGGFIARSIGPLLATSRKAKRHLQDVMPELSEKENRRVIKGMWDNLGRVFAEYPHIHEISKSRVIIQNRDVLEHILNQPRGAIFIGAHIGNWEAPPICVYTKYKERIDYTYREPNNPYVANLLENARSLSGKLRGYPKSRDAGRKMVAVLREKGYLGILVDQKYNEGYPIPFFGQPAMTNPVAFQLARKYDAALVPIRCERLNGCNFRLHIHAPLEFEEADGKNAVEKVMAQANSMLEQWIREKPEQWLWLHRRWSSKTLKEKGQDT